MLAVALLAYPVYLFVDDYRARNADLASLGVDLAAAGCDPVAEAPASGNQDHVDDGTQVTYTEFPPASGQHYAEPAPFTASSTPWPTGRRSRHWCTTWSTATPSSGTATERPDDCRALERIGKTFGGDDYNPADKFIAAPWAEADGGPFPEGKNVVLARWTADPNDPADTTKQFGVRQACTWSAVRRSRTSWPSTRPPTPRSPTAPDSVRRASGTRRFPMLHGELDDSTGSFLWREQVSRAAWGTCDG